MSIASFVLHLYFIPQGLGDYLVFEAVLNYFKMVLRRKWQFNPPSLSGTIISHKSISLYLQPVATIFRPSRLFIDPNAQQLFFINLTPTYIYSKTCLNLWEWFDQFSLKNCGRTFIWKLFNLGGSHTSSNSCYHRLISHQTGIFPPIRLGL